MRRFGIWYGFGKRPSRIDYALATGWGRSLRRPEKWMSAWIQCDMDWIRREVKFEQLAQRATLENHLAEVDHQAERIARLETAIEGAPATMRAVLSAL